MRKNEGKINEDREIFYFIGRGLDEPPSPQIYIYIYIYAAKKKEGVT